MDFGKIESILKEKCMLDLKNPIVIGVSGGPDSLCLLDLIRKIEIPIIVGHLDHGLREESTAEADFVQEKCLQWGIPCLMKKVDIMAEAKKHRKSVEEMGRIERYLFLFDIAKEKKAQAVAVAHNLDDQAETIMMHMIRGSGLAGLRGMDFRQFPNEWSESISLVRPLLEFSKKEIINYCQENGLSPVFDKTNDSNTYYRNRLRNELIPHLETYNPKIKDRLSSMAEVLRVEDDYLQAVAQDATAKVTQNSDKDFIIADRGQLLSLPPAILRRVIFKLLKQLSPETPNISFDIVDSAVKFLSYPSQRGRKSLAAGMEIGTYLKNSILLALENRSLDSLWPQINQPVILQDLPSKGIELNEFWRIMISEGGFLDKGNSWQASLDADALHDPVMDTSNPGDRFSPLGMNGKSIKLGDYWTNEGLPVRARANWPLIKSAGEIAWVPGFTIGEKFKITEKTRQIVSIRFIRI